MSDNYELAGSIRRSLHDIRTHWDAMLVPVTSGGQGGAASARITAEDHADTEVDIDRTTRVVSLRREVIDVLNAISRWVMEDRPVTVALPDGGSAMSMVAFIDRHAEWIADLDAQDNGYEAGRLRGLSERVTNMVAPPRREWISLGPCPLEAEFDPERGVEVCGGQVRAWPRAEDREGETMGQCRRCGTEAVASWWERKMFTDPELRQWLTDAELVPFLHAAFGIVVKEATIRQWVKRDVLKASGKDDHGRRLFNREAVVWAMHQRDKRERIGS